MAENNTDIKLNSSDAFDSENADVQNVSSDEIKTEELTVSDVNVSAESSGEVVEPLSFEEKIRSIRENAMNTYAKEVEPETEVGAAEENTVEENVSTEVTSVEVVDDVSNNGNDVSDVCGKTRDYNMSELIKVLQGGEKTSNDADEQTYDEEEEEKPKKRKNKFFGVETPDDEDFVPLDSEMYDDVNEYYHDFEYTEKSQGEDLFDSFRKSAVISTFSMILSLIATVLCVWFEIGHAAGLPFANVMNAGRYGRVFAMVCLEMLALCAFFNLDGLARGIRKLSVKHSAPEALAVVSTIVCTIHTVITAIFAFESTEYRTFCFIGCVILFMLSVNTFIKSFTRFRAFAMVLAKKPKLTTKKLENCSEEHNVFAKYLNDDSDVLSVSKTDFVSDFVKQSYTVPSATSVCNTVMYIILVISVAIGIVSAVLLDASPYAAITNAAIVFLLSAPVSCLAVTSIPYFVTSLKVNKMHSAIIGEAACDYYENAGVLSFDDTEVFPPKSVKVTSIKTYNDNRIDKVIVYMAKIFEKLGGPLSYVFASSLQNATEEKSEIMVVETSPDGLHIKIDDDDVLVGTGKYLRLYDIEAPVDLADETEMRSLTSIVYLVCNNQLAAKFYIRYALNRGFETVLRGLYDAGICCGVKTADPGVDNQLVSGNLKGTNYPISVIGKQASEIGKTEETVAGGIIGLSGIHSFLKSFILLDKLRAVYKNNSVFYILGAVVGLAVSIGLIFMNMTVLPSVMLMFQLVWLIPMILVSIFSK